MTMFSNVLCPVDFSDSSELALRYAIAVGARQNARLTAMHVIPAVIATPDVYPYLAAPIPTSQETRDRAFEQLGHFVHSARERDLAVDVTLEDGEVVDTILQKADALPADLIVMGTHGRRGFKRLLMGSVTERVLREARAPVLSVSPHSPGPSAGGAPFRSILCPVDFSPASLAGFDAALALAGDEGTVTVVKVLERYVDAGMGEAIALDFDAIRARQQEEAFAKLGALIRSADRPRIKLEVATPDSRGAYREILRIAERDSNDLIVMGVSGRSSADLLFFGSTANHVVRSAGCPVLTVRPPA